MRNKISGALLLLDELLPQGQPFVTAVDRFLHETIVANLHPEHVANTATLRSSDTTWHLGLLKCPVISWNISRSKHHKFRACIISRSTYDPDEDWDVWRIHSHKDAHSIWETVATLD